MHKRSSIILAVVSAKNDYANQIVTKYARDVDPEGERTLGVITKPDQLHEGSESEKQYLELAKNKDVVLQLGWHVLRNRDFTTRHSSTAERDQAEADFFSKGIWTALEPGKLGISALKPRLSRILRDHVSKELPSLIEDVQAGVLECKSRLNLLGVSRATLPEQRMYLHQVSQEFCKIVQHGVSGYYNEGYFANDVGETGYTKRMKAVVVNLLEEFANKMRTEGAQYRIVDEVSQPPSTSASTIEITRDERISTVEALIKRNRGQELPGFARHETVTILFREQCRPWEPLIKYYAEAIYNQVREGVNLALDHTVDPATKHGILRVIIDPALEDIKSKLDEEVERNLQQHLTGHPITFNHYFTDNIMKLRNDHQLEFLKGQLEGYFGQSYDTTISQTFDMKDLAAHLTNHTEADMSKFACSEALHYMEAYYKVALKFFVDDFGVHAVQQGLLDKLEGVFDPSKVFALTDAEIEDVAGESEDSLFERSSSTTNLGALKEALKIFRQFDRGRPRV